MERKLQITLRLAWLQSQFTHEAYLDGYLIEGFKEEFENLQNELKELENNENE